MIFFSLDNYSLLLFLFLSLPKEQAATGVPMLSGGKQTGSTLSKTSVRSGRVNSLDDSGSSPTASGSKAGGSLKRGSLSQPGNAGHQAARQASRPARPPRRLCSSRSFSSLHTSSLTAAPFMRSSRSLSRLDQRSAEDGTFIHVCLCSQVYLQESIRIRGRKTHH